MAPAHHPGGSPEGSRRERASLRRALAPRPRAAGPRRPGPRLRLRTHPGRDRFGEGPAGAQEPHVPGRPPARDLAARESEAREPRRGRAVRADRGRDGGGERVLRAKRSARAAALLRTTGEASGARRRGGADAGHRLHSRAGNGDAPDRRRRHRCGPAGDASHRFPIHPRRDPVPAYAPRGRE